MVRPWTERLGPFRAALREASIEARIVRVDIEPALNAALDRSRFDLVVYDPKTPNVTRNMLDVCLRDHRHSPHVVVFESVEDAVAKIKRALAEHLN